MDTGLVPFLSREGLCVREGSADGELESRKRLRPHYCLTPNI